MTASFDLTLIPLYRIHGQELPQLPGLLATTAPKHSARGREGDVLIIHLTLAGNAPVSSAEYNQISVQMAQRFYQVPGALTSAIRTTAELLNQFLVERNMRTSSQGQYMIGRMILAVLRDGQMTLAQCGPTQVFHQSGGETRPIHDATISGRGLGIGQSIPLHLAQCEVKAGDRLVFCTHVPAGWQEQLPETRADSAARLRQDLLEATEEDLNSVVIGVATGKGNISILRSEVRTPAPVPQPAVAAPLEIANATEPESGQTQDEEQERPNLPPAEGEPEPALAQAEEQPQKDEPVRLDLLQPGRFVRPLTPKPAESLAPVNGQETPAVTRVERQDLFAAPRQQAEIPEIARPGKERSRKVYRSLAEGLQRTRLFLNKASNGAQKLTGRLLPSLEENEGAGKKPVMLFFAIAIPLILITIAVMIYLKYGQVGQYQANYDMAVKSAVGAIEQGDPAAMQIAWESTLYYLDKAESYQVTGESQALRLQAENALDGMDKIIRLDFRPAIYGGLAADVHITRMAATGSELYLLDANTGSILLTTQGPQGYQEDLSFQCGPGEYEDPAAEGSLVSVGPLIDMASMAGGNDQNATVVGMDASGTLLFCAPGHVLEPFALETPSLGWGRIIGFVLSANGKEMYVLDEKTIWIYSYTNRVNEDTGVALAGPKNYIYPSAFFSGPAPAALGSAVDLAANGGDLFLLFADSHVSVCTYSDIPEAPSTCLDPATFEDKRAGHHSGVTISDAVFDQMLFDVPYNSALYLLEPKTHAVFMVSPHPTSLELIGQIHASWEMEKNIFLTTPATVMAMDTNRYLYLCIGNQVYYAAMP